MDRRCYLQHIIFKKNICKEIPTDQQGKTNQTEYELVTQQKRKLEKPTNT
jgi:hypothetical protein